MIRKNIFMIVCLFLILHFFISSLICRAQTEKESNTLASFKPVGELEEEKSFGPYVVRTYWSEDYFTIGKDDYKTSFEILKDGVRVYAEYGGDRGFKIDQVSGSDITGNGHPDLVIFEVTGGYHPYYLSHIFEIGNHFRHIETLFGLAEPSIYNTDNDPALEFDICDNTFAYWKTSFAESPLLTVTYKYRGTKYEVACDLMRKPDLSDVDFKRLAAEIKSLPDWKTDHPPPRYWSEMLNLMYTGNMDQVWEFAEFAWPPKIKGKQKFIKEFKEMLQSTVFWRECIHQN